MAKKRTTRDYDQAYTSFAWVYDTFMDNIPYDDWTDYLKELLLEYGVKDGLLLDLGCGTGNMTERMAGVGYDMIGIDNSEDMLTEAREKYMDLMAESMTFSEEESLDTTPQIMYLLQDMRSFELYGTVAAAYSVCDSMNYILEKEDLKKVFHLVNNYLDPEGIFIFDFKTPYYYKYITGNKTFADNREDCSFIWENSFDEEAMVNIYDMTIFVNADEEEEDSFVRYRETHYQKAWSVADFEEAAKAGGMKVLAVYDAFTHDAPREDSERIYMIVQEVRTEGKYYNE